MASMRIARWPMNLQTSHLSWRTGRTFAVSASSTSDARLPNSHHDIVFLQTIRQTAPIKASTSSSSQDHHNKSRQLVDLRLVDALPPRIARGSSTDKLILQSGNGSTEDASKNMLCDSQTVRPSKAVQQSRSTSRGHCDFPAPSCNKQGHPGQCCRRRKEPQQVQAALARRRQQSRIRKTPAHQATDASQCSRCQEAVEADTPLCLASRITPRLTLPSRIRSSTPNLESTGAPPRVLEASPTAHSLQEALLKKLQDRLLSTSIVIEGTVVREGFEVCVETKKIEHMRHRLVRESPV
eukprot:3379107-Amphidinium_carterae.3